MIPHQQPAFVTFDPRQPVTIYSYHLPHWRQEGVIYFVTCRLADSIPAHVLKMWAEDRRQWLATHGITDRLPPSQWDALYQQIPEGVRRAFEREQSRRFYVELDQCHGSCLLRAPEAAGIVAAAMHFHHGKSLYCGDFVIMPNHVHWLVAPYPGRDLEDLVGSVKRYSAVRINKLVKRSGRLWQKESFDHIVRNAVQLDRFREYVKDNPAKANVPAEEYIYYRADQCAEVGAE
jgi:type I restriction enzyme R subunit